MTSFFIFLSIVGCFVQDPPVASPAPQQEQQTISKQKSVQTDSTKQRIAEQNKALFEMDRQREARKDNGVPPNNTTAENIDILPTSEITLMDNSVIKGQIFDVQDGQYQVRGKTMEGLSIPVANVVRIQNMEGLANPLPLRHKQMSSSLHPNGDSMKKTPISRKLNCLKALFLRIQVRAPTVSVAIQFQYDASSARSRGHGSHSKWRYDRTAEHPKIQQLMSDPSILQLLGGFSPSASKPLLKKFVYFVDQTQRYLHFISCFLYPTANAKTGHSFQLNL